MRNIFGDYIVKLAEMDEKIILIVGDIGFRIFDKFREKFPNRFFNLGISEQSIVSFASGMALNGHKPYIYTITPFFIERAFEQIKIDVDAQNVNVKIIGYADYPELGITHNEINGIKLMSLFSNIQSYFPKSYYECIDAISKSYKSISPAFISLKEIENKILILEKELKKNLEEKNDSFCRVEYIDSLIMNIELLKGRY